MFTASNTSFQDTTIENDGFWPNINAGDFERLRGTPAAQDDERIAHAVVNAIASVNLQLSDLKAKYIAAGHASAADVPAFPKVNDKNLIVIQYQSAVFARAKADLLPDFATVSQKKKVITSLSDHKKPKTNCWPKVNASSAICSARIAQAWS